jgi:hypothetical protein
MASKDITVHRRMNVKGLHKVATIERACRRLMSCISSLRAARRRHASARMDIDTQTIVVISVPFHATPGSGHRRNWKVVP